MDLFEAIHTRRSIRKYDKKEVPEDLITEFLKAAMAAPSAHNEQPWQFIVVTDRKILEKISVITPYTSMVKEAPLGILVCGDLDLQKSSGFWHEACSAATQNLLLAVHASGLGAVWTGIYPKEEAVASYKKLFGLPENVVPFAFVVIGYPAEKIPFKDRFRKDRVHRDKWE